MSEIEPTKPGSYEPTQPASYNPCDIYPYSDVPELPPPPPKRRRKWARLLTTMLLVVFAGTVSVLSLVYLYEQSHRNVVPIIVPHIAKSTKVATPTPDPTHPPTLTPTKNATYTADEIVQAFQAAGLPTDNLNHSDAFREAGITAVPAQSSVIFEDQSLCGGFNCGEDQVYLNVYATAIDAATVAQQFAVWIQHPSMPFRSYPYQSGRCFMDGEPLTSAYVQIVKADCV